MGHSRRLTDQERQQIVRDRAKGVAVRDLATVLKVSPKTVYNVLGRGRSTVSANDSRTRVLTMRVSTNPVVCLRAIPSSTSIVRQAWMAASL